MYLIEKGTDAVGMTFFERCVEAGNTSRVYGFQLCLLCPLIQGAVQYLPTTLDDKLSIARLESIKQTGRNLTITIVEHGQRLILAN
ncbi:hypothetical protein [Salinisphaera sp. G21_0]|uniref:hypothetical protein n=1 Tax=Salinisphaera sp. G21_0 TaxID=2821094 RepID=UPI001ADBBD9C|nr:hypothetical protein [Salinisphaera sp. G21_0]MBO9481808.1 hypothetical protein [Salinisphaera sp. G21_0]